MKSKKANFQLIKIIAMLMIVSHHLVAKNSFNIDTQVIGITANKVALQVLGNNAFIGNNLFFLVSAWFLSSKMDKDININYSIKSCWKIERTVSFYSYVLCIVVLALGGGKSVLLQSIFPTVTGMWWYPTTYIIFLMIWPFYHQAILNFVIDDLKKYVLIILSVWSFSTLIPFANVGANNLIAFLMLYAIVILIKRLKITFDDYKKVFSGFILVPYGIAVLSIIILDLLGEKIAVAAEYSCYFMRGNYRPVSMMVSIGLFMWGTSWKVKTNKLINCLADATFGIYLFHMYPPVMKLLFENLFIINQVIYKPYAVLYCIAVTLGIFVVGVLIDLIRRVLFYYCTFMISRISVEKQT